MSILPNIGSDKSLIKRKEQPSGLLSFLVSSAFSLLPDSTSSLLQRLHLYKFILAGAYAKFLGVTKSCFPVGIGVNHFEVVGARMFAIRF